MNEIESLAFTTSCSKYRAASALKNSKSHEEAIRLIRSLEKQDAMNLDCE